MFNKDLLKAGRIIEFEWKSIVRVGKYLYLGSDRTLIISDSTDRSQPLCSPVNGDGENHYGRIIRVYDTIDMHNWCDYKGESRWGEKKLLWERPKDPEIEITVKINGKKAKLSSISDETLKKLKELED